MFEGQKFNFGNFTLSGYEFYALLAFVILVLLVFLVIWVFNRSLGKSRHLQIELERIRHAQDVARFEAEKDKSTRLENRLLDLIKTNAEMSGKIKNLGDVQAHQQSGLARVLNERMDNLGHKVGQSLSQNQKNTFESLNNINSRLSLIDNAQKNITDLSSHVVDLQNILRNKQARGAFGQGQMEAIIADGLPSNAYEFQATLSNGKRPDCLIRLPNQAASIVVDAKFPLEGFRAWQEARNDQEAKLAKAQVRSSVKKHINDIDEKYFIAGETQDTAIMFVPSEYIFVEIHENFDDLIQESHRKRVFIASPNMLMLAVHTIQSILKDAKMREQAHLIQNEVARMMDDMRRLDTRVANLSKHFAMVEKDVLAIQTSTTKIFKKGQRIDSLELSEEIIDQYSQIDEENVHAKQLD
ncbi:MAG: DNA recombination protein RmuC [Rhizobiales bacterium]|nr:DNA recombination protein RmuC [Hyphomicrobiales bacterium]